MIHINALNKNYGNTKVLQDIELHFEGGKTYGIAGENGAGKTTLFRCIAGLESYKGSIHSKLSPLKNHIGFLPTTPYFFPKITGEEYIRLLLNARQIKIKQIEKKNIFDLPLKHYASTYSTGMKKKLALTAILLQNNDYYILDEPYNGVDLQSNIIITEIINHLKSLGKVTLIASHIFATLANSCDEIHLLSKGKITKSVKQADYTTLEEEMKQINKKISIDALGLC